MTVLPHLFNLFFPHGGGCLIWARVYPRGWLPWQCYEGVQTIEHLPHFAHTGVRNKNPLLLSLVSQLTEPQAAFLINERQSPVLLVPTSQHNKQNESLLESETRFYWRCTCKNTVRMSVMSQEGWSTMKRYNPNAVVNISIHLKCSTGSAP